ncbi:hypothetical protein J4464_06310 [Candidatus Woesearchaeota archaeon]|nr:hypothetical protein [Candidatus Woesearchaeota archaeon]
MWKKICDSQDLISYQKRSKQGESRIEARLSDNAWSIYKIHRSAKKDQHVQEYKAEQRKDALKIIEQLKQEKPSPQIEKYAYQDALGIKLQREFKEYDVEKWSFMIHNDPHVNIVFVRFAEHIEADIILNSKYRMIQRKILDHLVEVLRLNESPQLRITVYYYSDKHHTEKHHAYLFGGVELS